MVCISMGYFHQEAEEVKAWEHAIRTTAQLTRGDGSLGAGSTTPRRDENKEGTHNPSGEGHMGLRKPKHPCCLESAKNRWCFGEVSCFPTALSDLIHKHCGSNCITSQPPLNPRTCTPALGLVSLGNWGKPRFSFTVVSSETAKAPCTSHPISTTGDPSHGEYEWSESIFFFQSQFHSLNCWLNFYINSLDSEDKTMAMMLFYFMLLACLKAFTSETTKDIKQVP